MINLWRTIETLPPDVTEFLGSQSVVRGMKDGGVLLRLSQIYMSHPFEQLVDGRWCPAFVRPKYWKRLAGDSYEVDRLLELDRTTVTNGNRA
jgi:hypothetical protein